MSSPPVGKQIFAKLREYPLPRKQRTQDYVFYFVPAGDRYGKGARHFFQRFYKNHRSKDVASLEALIDHLNAEIQSRSIDHVREIVIVAHGNAQGLIFPLVDGTSDTNLPQYRYLTPGALVLLQKDFLDGRFAPFNAKRKEVITRLTEDSWVTIRACNFGRSRAGLYAVHSFFGGRANVYSPKVFQFFGSHPIMPGMRLETKLEVHEHLVKQRFLPRDVHTPDRKDAIARFLADPARFSEPIDLLSADLSDDTAAETVEYDKVISGLNSLRVPELLSARLGANGITLSPRRRVIVRVRDASWVIRDTMRHHEQDHTLEYHLSERLAPPRATLQVEATIRDVHSAREFFPIQLFFHELDNDEWRGLLFVLAGHVEAPDAEPLARAKFEAVLALLDRLDFGGTGGGVDLVELFRQEGIELTPARTLSLLSEAGSGSSVRKTWLLRDSVEYLIKLEHPATSSGFPAHTLTVYERPGREAALRREYELMARLGADPDQPGTELLSYLDNRSFDELTVLIDHLRDPYRVENVPYLHHAVQAIVRKKDFLSWFRSRPEVIKNAENPDPLFELFFPYTNLSFTEREDKGRVVYSFESDTYWAEVKASNPPSQPFEQDLFAEQPLTFAPGEATIPDHLEPDSPATDIEELRALETTGLEQFFAVEKFTFEGAEADPEELSCRKFAEVIALLKSLEGRSEAEIEAALNDIKIIGDASLFNFYGMPKPIKWALDFWTITGTEPNIAEKVLRLVLPKQSPNVFRVAAPRIIARGLAYVGIATMVGEMFWNFLKEHANTSEVWEQAGKLAGIRQWTRRLLSLTFEKEDSFPTSLEIDIGGDAVAAYLKELEDESGIPPVPFVFAPDRMKKGFDEGVKLIEAEANEVLSKSDRIIDDALRREGLDACKIRVLRDAGIIDPSRSRAFVMREYARFLLRELPKP